MEEYGKDENASNDLKLKVVAAFDLTDRLEIEFDAETVMDFIESRE